MTKYINIKNLEKRYGKKSVLTNINLDIPIDLPIVIGIVGKNGVGKSTLLKTISGILLSNEGEIFVSNLPCRDTYQYWAKKNIAYIQSGERGLKLKNTVRDNIIYYGLLKGTPEREILTNIDKYSSLMKLEHLLGRKCESLSTGEKKKAQIMCGICSNVKILILDEPSNGLDISSVAELENIIHHIRNDQNRMVMVSSHDMAFIKNIATKYILLNDNKVELVESDKVEERYNGKDFIKDEEVFKYY